MKSLTQFLTEAKTPTYTDDERKFEQTVKHHHTKLSNITGKKLKLSFEHNGHDKASYGTIHLPRGVNHEKVSNYLTKHYGEHRHEDGARWHEEGAEHVIHRAPLSDRGEKNHPDDVGIHFSKFHDVE